MKRKLKRIRNFFLILLGIIFFPLGLVEIGYFLRVIIEKRKKIKGFTKSEMMLNDNEGTIGVIEV